jgi:hypothetical protein
LNVLEDPIVAETRKWREEMFEEAGGDLDSLFVYLRAAEEKYRQRLGSPRHQEPTDEPEP